MFIKIFKMEISSKKCQKIEILEQALKKREKNT